MAIKFLLLLVILYFIGKSINNMVKAVLNDPKAPPRMQARPPQERRTQWHGPSPNQARSSDGDIEDAKWVDL
ncbi:MAG: hypothetical protein ACE5G0_17525 [Rhodothermales bacterium]